MASVEEIYRLYGVVHTDGTCQICNFLGVNNAKNT